MAENSTLALDFFNKSISAAKYERLHGKADANIDAAIVRDLASVSVPTLVQFLPILRSVFTVVDFGVFFILEST